MKRLLFSGLFVLSACGAPNQSSQGVGFGNSTGAGAPTPGPSVAAAGVPKATVAQPRAASGAVPAELANVRPRVLARMREEDPVKVFSTRANISDRELASLSGRARDVIVGGLPKPGVWAGYENSHERFSAGLVRGQIARVRVNGRDFAHVISGKFKPADRTTIYALIAYRSGCRWNGIGATDAREYPWTYNNVTTWYVGLSC